MPGEKRFQLLRRRQRGEAWEFVAHGARYTEEEAAAHIALIAEHRPQAEVKRIKL
jgi:hypothetical protein